MTDERIAVVALGANLGDRVATLQAATRELASSTGVTLVAASGIYETDAVGGPADQPGYLNAVVLLRTALPARTLLRRGLAIEAAHGRTRSIRWGPRTLDVDLIAVGDESFADTELELPHPRAHERGFVLVPWLEADPAAVLPGRGSVAALVASIAEAETGAGVARRSDLTLVEPV